MQNVKESVNFLMDDNVDPLRSSWCYAETIIQREKYFTGYHLYTLKSSFDDFRKLNIVSENRFEISNRIIDPEEVWSFTNESWKLWKVKKDGIYYNNIKRIDIDDLQINQQIINLRFYLSKTNITEIFYCTDEKIEYSEDYFELVWKPLFFIHADGTVFWERYFHNIEFNAIDKSDLNRMKYDVIIPYYKGNLDNPCCIDLYNLTHDYVIKTFKRGIDDSFEDIQSRVEKYAMKNFSKDLHRVGAYKSNSIHWADWVTGTRIEKQVYEFDFTGDKDKKGWLHLKGKKTIQSARFIYSHIYALEDTNDKIASITREWWDEEGIRFAHRFLHFHKNGTIYWDENCNCKKTEDLSIDTDDLPF